MRVLIISPHFPPTNAADMQRVRLVLPYLEGQGVAAEVLSVGPREVAAPQDPWLADGLPSGIRVHRVKALDLKWGRVPGLGTLTFRALGAIRRKGNELLGGGRFDLIYFSTTQFGILVLGPEWKRRFGVPFAMDYQDPWVSDYYREHPEVRPPGGRLKYGIARCLSRRQEPRVLRECSGITSVSAAYPRQLAGRYPWLKVEELTARTQRSQRDAEGEWGRGQETDVRGQEEERGQVKARGFAGRHVLPFEVMPFPGDERDFLRVKEEGVQQSVFDPNDGLRHWVYVGRGGADMARAVRGIFAALSNFGAQASGLKSQVSGLRLHFIGTSYSAAGQGVKTIEPLAAEYGLEDIVREHPDRIPYSETLRCLSDADALMVHGSDDPAYTASKIYPYLLAGKPLLAVFHEESSVVDLMAAVGGGTAVSFRSDEDPAAIGGRIRDQAFDSNGAMRLVPLDASAFLPFTARSQAAALAGFFQVCLGGGPSVRTSPP